MTYQLFRYTSEIEDVIWLNETEARAWRGVIALQTQLRAILARGLQRDAGLSESDYEVLVQLSEAPDRRLRPFELGERTMWEKSRLSHHIRRMTERGLVTTEQCPTDSRGTVVVISDAGWDAITAAAPGHVRLVREIFIDRLSPEQLVVLGEIAECFTSGLSDHPCNEDAGEEAEGDPEA